MPVNVIEDGDLYFFYQPAVYREAITEPKDVGHFYMVMVPQGPSFFRSLLVEQKRLPSVEAGLAEQPDKSWAVTDYVTNDSDELRTVRLDWSATAEEMLPTRAAGAAKYKMIHYEDHTELAYALEAPDDTGPVQHTFNIMPQASYVIRVKNPDYTAEGYPGVEEKPVYVLEIKNIFDDNLIDLKDSRLLNHVNAQILLIGSYMQKAEGKFGIEFKREPASKAIDKLYGTFHMNKEKHPLEPIAEGQWPRKGIFE